MMFPQRIETRDEVIIRTNMLGFLIGFLCMYISYLLQEATFAAIEPGYIKAAEVIFMIAGYVILGRFFYLVYATTSDIRKAAKIGLNIHVSGSGFSLKNPIEHRYLKAEIQENTNK